MFLMVGEMKKEKIWRKELRARIASLVNQHEFEDFNGIVRESHVFIKFHGGVHPKATKLLEVTPVMFSEWKRSLKNHQVELENTIKLDSFEVLLDDEYKKTSFKRLLWSTGRLSN